MYKQQLREFLAARINLTELKNFIDDRLFELRQTPDVTDEQAILSNLELVIHESAEGMRSEVELYEAIRLVALAEVGSTINISPATQSAVNTYTFAAPVTEYHCPDTVAV